MGRQHVNTFGSVESDGQYACSTCENHQQPLLQGDTAPHCSNCKYAVTWVFVRPLGQRPIGFVIPS